MTGECRHRKEAPIKQNHQTRGDGRLKTPALCPAAHVVGRAAIIVAALVLVALAWIGARDAIRAHREEALIRVAAFLGVAPVDVREIIERRIAPFLPYYGSVDRLYQRELPAT